MSSGGWVYHTSIQGINHARASTPYMHIIYLRAWRLSARSVRCPVAFNKSALLQGHCTLCDILYDEYKARSFLSQLCRLVPRC